MTNQQPALPVTNKRQHIIDAAFRVLSRQGIDKLTIKEIAQEAEIAPGLVHYYFANKDEVIAAIARDVSTRFTRTIQFLRETVPPEHFMQAALRTVRDNVREQPGFYRTRLELYALGLRNPVLLPEIHQALAEAREGIRQSIRISLGESVDADSLAPILLACFDGLAMQFLVDPQFDLEAAYEMLIAMLQRLKS